MTELLSRPGTRQGTSRAPARNEIDGTTLVGHGVVAAGAAAGAGLLAIAVDARVTWAASPASGASASEAMRTIGQVWLIGHRVTLQISGGGNVALLPLGLLAIPALALVRAGTWLAHTIGLDDLRRAAAGGAVLGGCYALVGAVLATVSATDAVRPVPPQALVATGLIGTIFGTVGTLRGAGLLRAVWDEVPARADSVVRAAGAAAAVVLGVGAVLAVGALLLHAGSVVDAGRGLGPGPVGGVALVLVCLAYLPDAIVWGAAYAAGPGFAVGAHTSVSPLGVHLGAVPSLPLLAALPGPGSAPAYSFPALAAPVIAGAVAGVILMRRLPTLRIEDAAGWGFASGAFAGLALAVLAAVTSGPIGPGRLAAVGPSPWQVGLATGLEMGIAAAVAAAVAHRRLTAVV